VPRDHLCEIIVWNLHSSTDNKSDDSKDSFWEELEQIFDQFPAFTWCYSRKFYNVKKSVCDEHSVPTLKHSEIYLDLFWPGDSYSFNVIRVRCSSTVYLLSYWSQLDRREMTCNIPVVPFFRGAD